jgi:hypothetical protein
MHRPVRHQDSGDDIVEQHFTPALSLHYPASVDSDEV